MISLMIDKVDEEFYEEDNKILFVEKIYLPV